MSDSEQEIARNQQESEINETENKKVKSKKKPYKLSLNRTEDFNAKLKKRGVLYLARVPPRMDPTKVRRMLSEFGEVTRVYLEEEDKSANPKDLRNFNLNKLQKMLSIAIQEEDYEKASEIRDEINSRKSK